MADPGHPPYSDPPPGDYHGDDGYEGGSREEPPQSEWRVFVGGLTEDIEDEHLKDGFQEFGEVVDARVLKDRFSGRSRGFGFVTFGDEQTMQHAIEKMHQSQLGGRTITVNKARPQSEMGPRRFEGRDGDSNACFKCGKNGHWARECPEGDGGYGGRRGGYDRGGYDRGGYDRGYDRGGYDRGGYDRGGYDRGYDRYGPPPPRGPPGGYGGYDGYGGGYERGYERGGYGGGYDRGYDRGGYGGGYERGPPPAAYERGYGGGGGPPSRGGYGPPPARGYGGGPPPSRAPGPYDRPPPERNAPSY